MGVTDSSKICLISASMQNEEKGSLTARGLGKVSVAGPCSCELGLGHVHTRKSIHRMEGTKGRGPAWCTLEAGSAMVKYEG